MFDCCPMFPPCWQGGGRARDPKKRTSNVAPSLSASPLPIVAGRSSDARKLTAMGYLRSTNPTKHPVSWSRLWLKLFLIRIMMRMVGMVRQS